MTAHPSVWNWSTLLACPIVARGGSGPAGVVSGHSQIAGNRRQPDLVVQFMVGSFTIQGARDISFDVEASGRETFKIRFVKEFTNASSALALFDLRNPPLGRPSAATHACLGAIRRPEDERV